MQKIHQNLYEQFKQLDTLNIPLQDSTLVARIAEVNKINSYAKDKQSFSLVLHIDDSPIKEQNLVAIEAEGISDLTVLMVPINQIENTMHYEVVFN